MSIDSRRGAALAIVVVLAASLQIPAPASARPAAAGATETFVTMFSESGDWVGQGAPRFYYPGNAKIAIGGNRTEVTISASGGALGDSFGFTFAAPPEESLTTRNYERAQRAPFREAGRPGIDISGDGRGCNTIAGSFEVKRLEFDGDRPTSLWVLYEQHCEEGIPALFGEVRFKVPGDGGRLLSGPTEVRWPAADRDARTSVVPVVFVNRGSKPLRIKDARVTEGREAFSIRLDECSGDPLRKNKVCRVWLRFTTGEAGSSSGRLVVDATGVKDEVVQLRAFVYPGVTRWTMQSDQGDYIGQGKNYDYTPAGGSMGFSGTRQGVLAGVDAGGSEWWRAEFKPPSGDILVAGTTYENAVRAPFAGDAAGLEVTGEHRGCNELTGSFTVNELETYDDGSVRSFDISFEQHCEGGEPALRGRIRMRATAE